jgi:hypothetical protein
MWTVHLCAIRSIARAAGQLAAVLACPWPLVEVSSVEGRRV